MTLTSNYKDVLLERLSDPKYAAGYLTACADEGGDVFLLGLRNVAEALGGIAQLAEQSELNRESLYRMLSEDGNPRLSSLLAVLDAVGMQLTCVPTKHGG
jgi:probable addiction module antidote protein